MFYVMQVITGTEPVVLKLMSVILSEDLYINAFSPTKIIRKKFHGEWKLVREKLLPGYVLIESNTPLELYQGLKNVPKLTKILGKDIASELFYQELSKAEEKWLKHILGRSELEESNSAYRSEVGLSLVEIDENEATNKRVKILEGPMKNIEGRIIRYNLHKRYALIEVEFMGRKTILSMGIVIKGRDEI